MTFAQLIQAVRQNPESVSIPPEWGQGRASFGGMVVALAYEVMRAKVAADRPVRSLAITFVGPAEADTPTRFDAEVLREGRAVSQLLARVQQNGQVVALVQGSFGAGRESLLDIPAEPAPQVARPDESRELPYIPGVTPEFTRYLAMRWCVGGLPFSGTVSRSMGGWVRLRDQQGVEPVTEAHLLALVDAWPPAMLPYLTRPAAGSSLTWTIEFVQPLANLTTQDWCQYQAEIEHVRDGYGHVAAALWARDGNLLAISRQTVVIFA